MIDSPFLFTLTLFLEGARSKLKAGEYLFKQNASLQDVIDTIVSGKAILHSLTIPEGLTSQQIVERLRESDLLAGDIREIPREGALLPETYKFQRGDSRDKLLQKMAHDQKALLDEIWRRRATDLPLSSPYELVTLASIVEKETGKADERPRVAAVFINRLRKHMRLQSDPTIVYGLVGGQGPLGRPADAHRHRHRLGLQHLCHRRTAAGPHRQSRPRRARSRRQSVAHAGPVFRRRRHRRPCVFRQPRLA